MGTVFNRGTKDNPNWYVGYRENGRWVYKASRQPTKALAKRWVSEIDLSGGASLDEVSAVGHSSPVVTKRSTITTCAGRSRQSYAQVWALVRSNRAVASFR
jgi:hypothetical protein